MLTAEDDLPLCGKGTDNLVIAVPATQHAFQSMIEDLVHIINLVKGLSNTVSLEIRQKDQR